MNKWISFIIIFILAYVACKQEKFTQGKIIYDTSCANCHMDDGNGLGALYPALSKSEYLTTLKSKLPCLIKHGSQSNKLSTVYMPAHPNIEEASMTNLINYLSHTWGDQETVLLRDITDQLEVCESALQK